jgi:DNA-binding transcriptional LysR family regulator
MFHQYYKSIRCFHAVAKTGGFTSAAQYLHIGQPTVTDQVKALETRFTVELFLRTGRGVRLTAAGERLYAITQGPVRAGRRGHPVPAERAQAQGGAGARGRGVAAHRAGAGAQLQAGASLAGAHGVHRLGEATLRGPAGLRHRRGHHRGARGARRLHIAPYRSERIVAVVPEDHAWTQRAFHLARRHRGRDADPARARLQARGTAWTWLAGSRTCR